MAPARNRGGEKVILEGYFLKKKRDDKSSYMSSKYQKRYFRLTSDSLAYAKDPESIAAHADDVQYFSTASLQYVKRSQKVKLELRFPQRVLRLKTETPPEAEELEKALQSANMREVHSQEQAHVKASTPKAPQIPAQLKIATIEDDSDDDEPRARGSGQNSQGRSDVLPSRLNLGLGDAVPGEQRTSPRSMLANPKFGNSMVASAPRAPPAHEDYYHSSSARHDHGGGAQEPQGYAAYDDDEHDYHHQGLRPVPSGRSAAAPPPRQYAPSPALPRMPEPAPLPTPSARQPQEERLVLAPAAPSVPAFGTAGETASPERAARAAPAPRLDARDMEVLTLGPMSINSPSGRTPQRRAPPTDSHLAPAAVGRSASPAMGNPAGMHGSAAANGGTRATVDSDDWDSDEDDGDASPGGSQARRPAAPHVGARWAKAPSGKWEADDASPSPRSGLSPGMATSKQHVQHAPSYDEPPAPPNAGVKMDANFAEDDWDSDDE